MARLYVRNGINPDDPDAPVVALLVDPDGTPGERAVAKLSWYGHEGDGAFFLLPTDGWAEHALDGNRLTVAVAAYPFTLEQIGADPAAFPERSPGVPEAALVLHAEAAVDPVLYARVAAPRRPCSTPAPGSPWSRCSPGRTPGRSSSPRPRPPRTERRGSRVSRAAPPVNALVDGPSTSCVRRSGDMSAGRIHRGSGREGNPT